MPVLGLGFGGIRMRDSGAEETGPFSWEQGRIVLFVRVLGRSHVLPSPGRAHGRGQAPMFPAALHQPTKLGLPPP